MASLTTKQKEKVVRLLADGIGQQAIADQMNISRYQVRVINEEFKNQRREIVAEVKAIDKLEEYREEIFKWSLEEKVSNFLICRRLQERNITVSESTIKRMVQKRKKEVYVPQLSEAGQEAQVDYGYLGRFEKKGKEVKAWVFCMVLSYSRYAYYTVVTEQTTRSFIQSHIEAFEFFGGIPRSVIIDNLAAAVNEADPFQASFQQQYADFMQHSKCEIITARICRGQDKGKVEAGIKYVKSSFLKKLNHRDFRRLITDLRTWNKNECNLRIHGTTRKVPNDEFIKQEKRKLQPLPRLKFKVIEKAERTVDNFGHIFHAYNFYSVPAHYAGERVIVESDAKMVKVFKDSRLIASHKLLEGKGNYATVDAHKSMYKQVKNRQYYQEQALRIGSNAARLLDLLIADKPYHWKNMIKGILRLAELYLPRIIDLACEKAIEDSKHNYLHVKWVLSQKLYRTPEPPPIYPKDTNGFYHDLDVYDALASKFTNTIKSIHHDQ